MQINPIVIYIVFSLAGIVLIATAGAIASRKMNFNYSLLGGFSLFIYIFLGYFVSKKAELSSVVLSSALIGFFDSTIGWKLCLHFNPNFGINREKIIEASVSGRIIFVVILSIALGYVGHLIAG